MYICICDLLVVSPHTHTHTDLTNMFVLLLKLSGDCWQTPRHTRVMPQGKQIYIYLYPKISYVHLKLCSVSFVWNPFLSSCLLVLIFFFFRFLVLTFCAFAFAFAFALNNIGIPRVDGTVLGQ